MPAELATVLAARGTAFRRGVASSGIAGIIDVAPTAAALLGIPVDGHGFGRVLAEGLALAPSGPSADPAGGPDGTLRRVPIIGRGSQTLTITERAGAPYIDGLAHG